MFMLRIITAFTLTTFAAVGGQLTITSYDMINGTAGGANYLDTSYNGSGNPGGSSSSLSGGTGKLTDGYVPDNFLAPVNDNNTWVGWQNLSPTITLNFDSVESFGTLRLYLQKGPAAGIYLPAQVDVAGSQTGATSFSGLSATDNTPGWFDFNISGFSGDKLTVTLQNGGQWTFLGEVQVLDTAVPEPATGALAALAIGSILIRRRFLRE